jgi:hypothetical protein
MGKIDLYEVNKIIIKDIIINIVINYNNNNYIYIFIEYIYIFIGYIYIYTFWNPRNPKIFISGVLLIKHEFFTLKE